MKRIVCVLLALLVALPLFSAAEGANRYEQVFDTSNDGNLLTVRFVSLTPTGEEKQGDCTILRSPDGQTMVIDAGEPSSGSQVVDALKAMGVEKVDFLIASHPHIDHIGGFPAIMRAFEVGAVYTTAVDYSSSSHYRAYMEEIEKQGIEHIILSEGDTFSFGEEITAEVLHPGPEIEYYDGYPNNSTQFINNLSLVLRLQYKDSSLLFAGDLYTGGEKDVLARYTDELRVDVAKMNHHGASTSSSKTWRETVGPQIAVAMHDAIADIKVLQKYHREGVDVYITFLDGTVKVSTPGDGTYEVLTQYDRANPDFLD